MDESWIEETRISDVLWRVVKGDRERWFVCDGRDDVAGQWTTGRPREVTVRTRDGHAATGLLVTRCEGGRIADLLWHRGALSLAQTLAVLHDTVIALANMPAAPPGSSRVSPYTLGIDGGGQVAGIAGMFVDGEQGMDDATALARLAHALLTGDPDTELGAPPTALAPDMTERLAVLLDDLARGTVARGSGDCLDLQALLLRIDECGVQDRVTFYPAEPGVDIAAAATADLPAVAGNVAVADLRAQLRTPRGGRGAAGDGKQARAGQRGTGRRSGRGVSGERENGPGPSRRDQSGRRRRDSRGTTSRTGWLRIARRMAPLRFVAFSAAVVCLLTGAALVVPALGGGTGRSDEKTVEPNDPGSSSPHEYSRQARALRDAKDPAGAWLELTRQREVAYETADAMLLRGLSAAGSPAARAEDLDSIAEFKGKDVSLKLADVVVERLSGTRAAVTSRLSTSVSSAGGTVDYGTQRLLAELVYESSGWLVHKVTVLKH